MLPPGNIFNMPKKLFIVYYGSLSAHHKNLLIFKPSEKNYFTSISDG